MDWLIAEFKKDSGIDVSNDKLVRQRLKDASEKAKIDLSNAPETEIHLPFLTADASGPKHLQIKLTRARFEAMPRHELAPAEPVDVGELADQLKAAQAANQENTRQRQALAAARDTLTSRQTRVANLRAELAKAEEAARSSAEAVQNLETSVAGLLDVDTAALLEQIRGAEAINRQVRENHERRAVAAEHAVADRQSGELTAQIEAVDQQKAEAIAAARMPVQGLGFDAAGVVTLNGLPLDQASAAERLRVSVAIGLAMNPRLRVLLIRDASLLDRESMRVVAGMAREAGAQLWVERVEVDEQTTVLIEDGQVVEPGERQAAAG